MGRVAINFRAVQGANAMPISCDLGQASNAGQRKNRHNPSGARQKG